MVQNTRGGIVESVHRLSVVVVDADGRVRAGSGDVAFPTYVRSAAKPFQAMPLIADGATEALGIGEPELALACASHNSERRQVERVAAWLGRLGLAEEALVCGPHPPLGKVLALGPATRSHEDGTDLVAPSRLASNCSGKHTGMLSLALHHGWETRGYHQPDHPVQQAARREVREWAGVLDAELGAGVDGCGVIAFSLPLRAMATAYARLVTDGSDPALRVRQAMMRYPELVAGEGRLDTALMRALPGRVVSKVGAEGVYGVGLVDRGLGLALKVEDGDASAAMVALVAALRQLEILPPDALAPFASLPIVNTRGDTVGEVRASGSLKWSD
jgi:L-asparaginase II